MEENNVNCPPFFSIIIPVYNVGKFLEQCIESVLVQKEENYEIILIDDGSTDFSGEICDKYAERDGRIRTFHQKNSGLGVARNTGISYAKGTWILFLDSDDYWIPNTLEKISRAIREQEGRKLFVFRYMEDHGGKIIPSPHHGFESGVDKITDLLQFLERYEKTAGWAVWKLAIHRSLIYEEETLFFLDNVSHGEDLYWLLRLFQRACEATYCDVDIYRYRVRRGSLSESSPQNCLKWRESLNNTFDWFCVNEKFDRNGEIKQFIALHYMPYIFDSASMETVSEWEKHYDEMKKILGYISLDTCGKRGKILLKLAEMPKKVCFFGCIFLKKVGKWRLKSVKVNE